ncbi:DNA polymerase-3 subunit epsilon [Ruaniaceae bacterium KH17]|nr:DNA polymerase-3 subunit epsilon [Ruaniaceae bacterium KH17]
MSTPTQLSFDSLGTPLSEVTFVVVDLETTGGRSSEDSITEIGAVKLKGGEVAGEFQTLVNPRRAIPHEITSLTGISSAMVAAAPILEAVLPTFLEFARFGPDTVLVAHNARFDVGFLKAACARYAIPWPAPPVVDTLLLSRRALSRQDTPNHKLGTLARVFGTEIQPTHRALDDARATGEILHRLLERLAPLGLTHAEDLRTITARVPATRRAKSSIATGLPTGPGVYQFVGRAGDVLYVGSSTNLHARVKSYFTAGESRRRMGEMLDLAVEVRPIECATLLEARVRELRLIDSLQPPYNIRSRRARTRPWLRLTNEVHPRLTITRSLPLAEAASAWGPFSSQAQARAAMEALAAASGLRTCNTRLPLIPSAAARACAAHEMGRCSAPCIVAGAGEASVSLAHTALSGDVGTVIEHLRAHIATLSAAERYEEARDARERLRAVLVGASRAETLRIWARQPLVVGARPGAGVWELAVLKWGRLAGVGVLRPGADVDAVIEEVLTRCDHVPMPSAVGELATAEETQMLAAWFTAPDCRLARVEPGAPPIACQIDSAARIPLPPTD